MTWARIDDCLMDTPAMLALPRGVRLAHIEAITWCCRHLTDGAIPRHALARISDEPDAAAAAVALVAVSLWTETPTGWQIVDFTKDQSSKEQVEQAREVTAFRQRRARRHKDGQHDLCEPKWCPALKAGWEPATAGKTDPAKGSAASGTNQANTVSVTPRNGTVKGRPRISIKVVE